MAKSVLALAVLLSACPLTRAQQSVDGIGRPVSASARAELAALEGALPQRRLAPQERALVLTLLNSPEMGSGPFKERRELVRWFLERGVRLSPDAGSDLADTDIWRLVRAARAAAEAFHIPPAVLLCLTFRESSFDPRASAWTTTAKGVGQMTNVAVTEAIHRIERDPVLRNETQLYATLLGARMPSGVEGASDVDALTREVRRLELMRAPGELLAAKKRERRAAIASHKDELGHIYNLETNFGLSAAYLAHLRRKRLAEVVDEQKGWLTAVGAYNQGLGVMNQLIYDVFRGPRDFNAQPIDAAFSPAAAARLAIPEERRHELLGEVGSVHTCSRR
ncbi:MAG: hypothetical protein HY553_03135 [Elusimicrobia bacterium]|nr:hypothetical protein [Elusimicrobiota bacterium]